MTIYRGQGGLGDSYNDPELVHTSGDETIEGVKTFTSTIIGTISGHYTKAEEDAKLALKANQSTTYTKTEVDSALNAKADQSTTYTKTEVDTALTGKLSTANGSVGTNNLANNAVTYAKMQNVTAGKVLGRDTSGTGVVQELPIAVDTSGNLLVGTTSGTSHTYFSNGNSVPVLLMRNGSTSGVAFGATVNFSGQAPNNSTSFFLQCNDTAAERATIRSNGGFANYSANNVNLSDERTKTDISDAGDYLHKICAIPVRTFKYKDQADNLLNLGVIAQEVETVAPELVDVSGFGDTPDDGVPLKAIYQTDLQYALMKCIQELASANAEQQAMIEQLKADVAALKGAA